MKRFYLLTLVCIPFMLHAALRTEKEALRIARSVESPTYTVAARTNAYYAVNTEKGFVLVGADDRFPEVLGWSDNGSFDEANLPPAFVAWLEMYEQEALALDTDAELIKQKVHQSLQADVFPDEKQPLLTTQWDQGKPYNNLCPSASYSTHCLTGCGATAMAQVMKFHRYPSHGISSHTYGWRCKDCASGYRDSVDLSADFANTTYDWDHMRNSYDGNYSTVEAEAVATLMYHCGVSINMKYGKGNSNSSIWDIASSLITYFGYGKDMELIWKEYYTAERFMTIIHDDIQAGHPIIVRGADSQGNGHIFACDGYNRAGYFHFNWGWGGSADGYFWFTQLNPSRRDYNYGVQFLTKIHPDANKTTRPHYIMRCDSLELESNSVGRNSKLYLTAHELRNYNYCTLNGKIGVMLTNAQTNQQIQLLWESYPFTDFTTSWGWTTRNMNFSIPSSVPAGSYWIDVVYTSTDYEDPWESVIYYGGAAHGMKINVTSDAITRVYDDTQGIENIPAPANGERRKVLIDGRIYILSGDKVYSEVGQQIK